MKNTYRKLAATFALACLTSVATTASAEILNFDDLPGGPSFFTTPYHGLTFTDAGSNPPSGSWFWTKQLPPIGAGANSPTTYVATEIDFAAPGVASGLETESQRVKSTSPFRLDGAWFSSTDTGSNKPGDPGYDPVTVTFLMYLNNVLVANSATLSLGDAYSPYKFLASGYAGPIDSFTVYGLQGFFAMDDLGAVPEPASYALVILALSGLALSKRRIKS